MIQIFEEVAQGANTRELLAARLKKSLNWISEILNQLEEEGFVIKNRCYTSASSRIRIELSGTQYSMRMKELAIEYQAIKLEDILANVKLLYLAALCEDWISMQEASKLCKISIHTIRKINKGLMDRGIIIRKNRLYTINSKMWLLLRQFLVEYKNYGNYPGQVKWRFQDEAIFKVTKENNIQGSTSGFYQYKDYGVTVGVISALCTLPKRELSKEEIFVHSLFEVDDPRTLHLAMAFYLKNKLNYSKVLPIAMKFGKYTLFINLMRLFDAKDKKIKLDQLPMFDRNDFIRILDLYEVKNVYKT